jgi:hypothetical protein
VVGQIMIIVWAFAGENESRKELFRAILVFFLLFIGLVVLLAMLGSGPAILKYLESVRAKWLRTPSLSPGELVCV